MEQEKVSQASPKVDRPAERDREDFRRDNCSVFSRVCSSRGGELLIVAVVLVCACVLPIVCADRGSAPSAPDTIRVARAYIGPGAGFAFLTSFLSFFVAFLLAGLIFVTTPLRILWNFIRRRKTRRHSKFLRVVVIGLDGMSPRVARRMINEGKLPHFARLAAEGCFRPLRSTLPPISPVAWSTFQTGANPDKHNIFDFLAPDRKTYSPVLSSSRVEPPERILKLGKYHIPLGKPSISLIRKSQPFWKLLGERGVFSIVLRVPVTFPPEKFQGVMLSGMCVPDLRGSQGSFTYFTSAPAIAGEPTGGTRIPVKRVGDRVEMAIPGPENPLRPDLPALSVPLTVLFHNDSDRVTLQLPGQQLELAPRSYSPWVRLTFRAGLWLRVTGICRFWLKESSPHLKLYVTPLNVDPDRPALPISHPVTYASYLAKVHGPYATLGLAEDTWALNEKILDESAFLEQTYDIYEERKRMFFDALEKISSGFVCCVFDITDRIQHMFFQYTPEARSDGSQPEASPHAEAVEECYRRMDALVGETLKRLGKRDLLLVMSDHGFASFHSCVNLNSWLHQHGFLALKHGAVEGGENFEQVDWPRTKAYGLGLGGIYINQVGRERHGTVHAGGEKEAVVQAIVEQLESLTDPDSDSPVVNRVFDTAEHYSGPYADNGPDLFVGFRSGYRVSWDSVLGKFGSEVIEKNGHSWSADHCVDPDVVPGVIFSNRPLGRDDPGIVDLAATVLDAFGVPIPKYMDGRTLLAASGGPRANGAQQDSTGERKSKATQPA